VEKVTTGVLGDPVSPRGRSKGTRNQETRRPGDQGTRGPKPGNREPGTRGPGE